MVRFKSERGMKQVQDRHLMERINAYKFEGKPLFPKRVADLKSIAYEDAVSLVREYRRLRYLHKISDGWAAVPEVLADIWRLHAKDADAVSRFQAVIGGDPDEIERIPVENEPLTRFQLEDTARLYEREFGEPMPRDIWRTWREETWWLIATLPVVAGGLIIIVVSILWKLRLPELQYDLLWRAGFVGAALIAVGAPIMVWFWPKR